MYPKIYFWSMDSDGRVRGATKRRDGLWSIIRTNQVEYLWKTSKKVWVTSKTGTRYLLAGPSQESYRSQKGSLRS